MASKLVANVLPGTDVTFVVEKVLIEGMKDNFRRFDAPESVPTVRLGQGLIQGGDGIRAVIAGSLVFAKPCRFWVEAHIKRYIPVPNNLILGFVTARLADAYKIDIGSTQAATLPFSGFEGTTKKNRPILNIGDIVFARVSVATKDLEPEIVCYGVDADSPDAASGFGEIKADWGASMIYHCSCSYARRLQSTNCLVLEVLGRFYAFEIVVGANGRFVIHTANHFRDTFRIAHVIMNFADQPDPSEESIVSFIKSTKSTFAVHR